MFGVPVLETYGMTEAASQIAANPFELRKIGSVGRAAGPEIAIMDEAGRTLAERRAWRDHAARAEHEPRLL